MLNGSIKVSSLLDKKVEISKKTIYRRETPYYIRPNWSCVFKL